jgi:exopolysaccharide biosynthesis protein
MKKLNHLLPLILLLLCVSNSAQDFKTVQDGIEYAEVTRGTKEEPVRMNLLKLDLKKVRLDVVHALDAAIGLEKTSSIASRHGAFAAINAGFFKMEGLYKGDAAGVLQIDGEILSESYANRTAILINNGSIISDVVFSKLNTTIPILFKKQYREALGINRPRGENDFVIYTPTFHRTTLTDSKGIEFVVKKGKVVAINKGAGSSIIPSEGFVLSFSGNQLEKNFGIPPKIGERISYSGVVFDETPELKTLSKEFVPEDIVAGVPLLIKDGKIAITWQEEKIGKEFVETRHPRTAVAKLKDGKFLMITVDGRQAGYSVGMNLNELAAFLLEIGATDAMNLDGGGSTTMFLDGKLMNKPSDKEGERNVSDAILVTLREKK